MEGKVLKYRLLVEGKNDQHVIWNLAKRLQLKETFEVVATDSYQQLLEALPVELKGTNVMERLGIVMDADQDATAHWLAIRNILLKSGYYSNLPEMLPADGLIIEPDDEEQLIVGVWIMPDNRVCGMMEDFVACMIPEGDQLLDEVDATLKYLEENKLNRYKPVHHAKARIHTWLAWQNDPGMPMGTAITCQILSADKELCGRFVSWLCKLFDCRK